MEIFLKPFKTFYTNPVKVPRPLVALALAKNLDSVRPWCVPFQNVQRCFRPNNMGHRCAILARIFWVLAWDRKISRYLGIVLRLSLNFTILGIFIEIVIEFWVLQYWYWYWYLVLMFLVLILRLISKFLALVSIIGIVGFHKLIALCNQGVNNWKTE